MEILLEPVNQAVSCSVISKEVAVPIRQCSLLVERCHDLGVEGYQVGEFYGAGFLNRYMPIRIPYAPMLIYKNNVQIPLVFRKDAAAKALVNDPLRLPAFFKLLDWYLSYDDEAEKVVFGYESSRGSLQRFTRVKVIDSALVAFRLSEIIDAAGYSLKALHCEEDFIEWNRKHRLVSEQRIGRHSRVLNLEDPKRLAEVQMIFDIVRLKYPEVPLFPKKQLTVVG